MNQTRLVDDIFYQLLNKISCTFLHVFQVMKTENGDVSVPITWAYNHHYCAYLSGSYAEMKELDASAYPFGHHNHGASTSW